MQKYWAVIPTDHYKQTDGGSDRDTFAFIVTAWYKCWGKRV